MNIGDRNGNRTILEIGTFESGRKALRVRCDCGTESIVAVWQFQKSKHCVKCNKGLPGHKPGIRGRAQKWCMFTDQGGARCLRKTPCPYHRA